MNDRNSDEPISACLGDDALLEVIVEARDCAASKQIESHLGQCERCQQRLEELSGASVVLCDVLKSTVAVRTDGFDQFMERIHVRGGLSLAGALTADGVLPTGQITQADDYSNILEPPSRSGLIGMLGDYEIEEKVAAGGMGIVFRARDPALNRTVAIKVLRLAHGGMNDARERFVREAQAIAGIDHENIIPIYQVNHDAKAPFLVMPFIRGRTLDEVVQSRGQPLSAEEIVGISRQVASGLAAAHDRGIIHRDIKPANLLLEDATDRVWIADFGLARAIWDPSLTLSGSMTGTPLFMSPEQAGDSPVDARSDLFSLGSVLYFLATAKLPFTGARSLSILRKVCEELPPEASTVNPSIPEWLAALIARLMQKDPADRPQSAEEILAMLDYPDVSGADLAADGARPQGVVKEREIKPMWIAACGALFFSVAVAIGIALDATGLLNPGQDRETVRHSNTSAGKVNPSMSVSIVKKNGSREPVESLAIAVHSVHAGDVIELSQVGEFTLVSPPLHLDRAVTLRAGKGQPPVIECEGLLFETAWPLQLEGLVLRSTGLDTPVIDSSGDVLTLTNCKIENTDQSAASLRRRRQPVNPILSTALIQCAAVPSVVIRNCQLVSETTLLRLQPSSPTESGGATIHITNSVLQASAGFTLELARDVRLEMMRCLVRTDHNLFSLHRNPRYRSNGACNLQLTFNSIIGKGPVIGFGNADIVDSTRVTCDANAWGDRTVWSAGILPARRANSGGAESSVITRNHDAFLNLLGTRESDPIVIMNSQMAKESLRSVARKFPAKRRPDVRILGPGSAYEVFRESPLYERAGR
ncbi:MAG: serine/threonine protein kinase [Verrucomicrobiae bacterium]|nr:serine/threonine protein kinase [Verrucomicrobiae bacterium]